MSMHPLPVGFVCLLSALSAGAAAQTASDAISQKLSTSTTDGARAYVYVSSTPARSSGNEVVAYTAAADGRLTPITGSPFEEDVTSMAVNGKYLVAVNANGFDIDSYRIGSNGALHFEASKNASESGDCNSLGPLFFDRDGKSLYDMETDGSGCANNTYVSFSVAGTTGDVQSLGNSGGNAWLALPASFIADDVHAYSASCIEDMYWGIYGFKRNSEGKLSSVDIKADPPTPPNGYFYCPALTATDATNHVVITMQPVNQDSFSPDRPAQLAAYTAGSSGNLSTESTAKNMPQTEVGSVNDLKTSPGGNLLAVGGSSGLQVFHLNGAKPITKITNLLTKDEIDQCFWDKENHLYAISSVSGKLFVFTLTAEKATAAPGSPYEISSPVAVVVQSLP